MNKNIEKRLTTMGIINTRIGFLIQRSMFVYKINEVINQKDSAYLRPNVSYT
ncbi:hypothetical protein M4I21_12840 [Cellulophaga sp. 20_2_10]|uniref:hypothetical protein n=1 Tax=Cellulophaga sp. 20_2_10 TaxID=2942476 RepID=UPI00201AE412|nr:hypothetical protein [Cellulophaga sp. 20_2_10]MCL5246704.1 hypothetical protein [Cellulophaga sp. 20_2_10]